MERKQKRFLIVSFAVLATMVLYGGSKVPEYHRYQEYASFDMAQRVSELAAAVLGSEKLLTDVAASKAVTERQANELEEHFIKIMTHAQKMHELAYRWERVKQGTLHNETAMKAQEAWNFFTQLRGDVTLDSEQLQRVHTMQALVLNWANVIRMDLSALDSTDQAVRDQFWAEISNDGIREEYWVKAIEDLETATRTEKVR